MSNSIPEKASQYTFNFDALISTQHIEDAVHNNPPFERQCSQCLKTKPLSEFEARKNSKNKRCKVCINKYGYQANLQKQCDTCLEVKSPSEFGANSKYGRNQSCKVCVKKAKYHKAVAEPGQTKQCTGCLETKPITSFSPAASGRYGVRGACKVCCTAYQKERYRTGPKTPKKRNPNSGRIHKLRTEFGMTLADYEKMFIQQKGVCAICGNPEKSRNPKTGKIKNLSVDHCHTTGTIRGLLCLNCNHMLGSGQDTPDLLRKGADYLEKYSK
jgi:hypothetical protein